MFPKPFIDLNRCLRTLPGKTSCDLCQKVCPLSKLKIDKNGASLPSNCFACHFCTAACPEGAIQGFLPPLSLLTKDKIQLRCYQTGENGDTIIPCAGAIPLIFLKIAAWQKCAIHLVTGQCDKCQFLYGFDLFQKQAAQVANSYDFYWSRRIEPFSEIPRRRKFFKWFTMSVMPFKMRTTDYNKLLNKELKLRSEKIRPVLTKRCIGCTVCQAVCPHHVFRRKEEEAGVVYRVAESHCTGCKKCIDNCLFQGIRLENSLPKKVHFYQLKKQNCVNCHEEFVGMLNICPKCRLKGR